MTTEATVPRAIQYRKLSEVVRAERNPRVHNSLGDVKASIRRFGFVEGAVHDGRTDRIIAGHGRLEALESMRDAGEPAPDGILPTDGDWLMPLQVGWASKNDAEAEALLVALNRLTETGGWNDAELAKILTELREDDDSSLLALSGYDDAELDKLLESLSEEPDLPTFDDDALDNVPKPMAEAKTRRGDVWILGDHKVSCGDAALLGHIKRLMGDEQADMVWTDPPYGVAYEGSGGRAAQNGGQGDRDPLVNDEEPDDDFKKMLRSAFANVIACTKPGAAVYVTAPPGRPFLAFAEALAELDVWRHTLAWVKDSFVFGRADYHYRHEAIIYGWKPGAPRRPVGDRGENTVWEIPRPKKSEDHPTMKPVELVARSLRNSSQHGDIILDVFGGSGTTLIAAETLKRVARVLEISPVFCDVICRRYQNLTGILPVLEATGEAHDFAVFTQEGTDAPPVGDE